VSQHHQDSQPDNEANERFLPASQVRTRYGVSDMWVHRRLHDDSGFPKPIKIGDRRFWKLSNLIKWERSLIRDAALDKRKRRAEAIA
jgi:predicted DNA-binding transcriptional regulator AlpA